jgi:hypothetical protein
MRPIARRTDEKQIAAFVLIDRHGEVCLAVFAVMNVAVIAHRAFQVLCLVYFATRYLTPGFSLSMLPRQARAESRDVVAIMFPRMSVHGFHARPNFTSTM